VAVSAEERVLTGDVASARALVPQIADSLSRSFAESLLGSVLANVGEVGPTRT